MSLWKTCKDFVEKNNVALLCCAFGFLDLIVFLGVLNSPVYTYLAGLSQRVAAIVVMVGFFFGFAFVLLGLVRLWIVDRRKVPQSVQLIAWEGYGAKALRDNWLRKEAKSIAVLEYVRGIEKVVDLKFENSLFDVVIIDIEAHSRPALRNHLIPLPFDEYRELWDVISGGLRWNVGQRTEWHGLPVRCGLNALLVNDQQASQLGVTMPIASYSDMKLSGINGILAKSSTKYRIGLWNWYLPTLPILIMMEYGGKLEDVWNCPDAKVKELINLILQNPDKFYLCNTPQIATECVRTPLEQSAWIMPGGGAWLLPLEDSSSVKVIIPNEGAILWVECASIIRDVNQILAPSKTLIHFLLQTDTQEILAKSQAFRGCPVTTEAINHFRTNPSINHASFDLHNIFNQSLDLNSGLVMRRLPKQYRLWEELWEQLDGEIEALGPR